MTTSPPALLQSKREMLENMAANRGQIRLRIDQIRKTDMTLAVQSLPEPEKWSVQVFRSIDSGEDTGATRCQEMEGVPLLGKVVLSPTYCLCSLAATRSVPHGVTELQLVSAFACCAVRLHRGPAHQSRRDLRLRPAGGQGQGEARHGGDNLLMLD